ncbi:3'-5' exonuclease [Calothrix sp. NIES-4071]|nr:3'-5' exonuclease [Calothrix sp. NIES-4071]BAZ63213.1 3'-5' exonuclease [Calothrix sp. NIES-4105]
MPYLDSLSEIRKFITECTKKETLWLDTEVADFRTKTPKLSLIQVLDDAEDMSGKRIFILDVLEQPDVVKDFINTIIINPDIEKVFHNASFDLKYLGGSKKAKNITCTLEMAKKIPYHILPLQDYKLQTLASELCHFDDIDKQQQTSDWGRRPLSEDQIEYAILDCIYLAQVHQALLELKEEVNPDPETDDIVSLTKRYKQIEDQYKILNSEYEHLQERIKKAMQAQNITETSEFKLTSYERTTVKVALGELVKLVEQGIDIDFPVTLTKDIQKGLGENLEQLNVDIEKTASLKLTPQKNEDDF